MSLDTRAPRDARYGLTRCACGRVVHITGTLSTPNHYPGRQARGPYCPQSLRPVRLFAVTPRP